MSMDAARLQVTVVADTSPAERGLQSFSKSMQGHARSLGAVGLGMSAAITAPLVGVAAAAFNVGKDFESAFTGVIKTFSGTTAEVEVLRQGILDMANELPATAVEISAVAEAAGALGIEKENILGFTRTIIDMAEATDMTAEQASNDMARFANIMKMPQDQFDRMGSTIVALGNAGASTESEIMSMGMRIAGTGSVVGMSEAQLLGWASAMASVGLQPEAAGTAYSTFVTDMAKEVATGGKNLKKFAKVAGVSAADFAKAFEEDASAATLMFIEGLGGIEEKGGSVFQTLEDLGLSDRRVSDTLLRLSGNTDLIKDSLDTANQAWEENIALAREAELRYGTTQSKIAIMQNQLKGVGITLFDTFKPSIEGALDGLSGFIGGISDAISGLAASNPALVSAAAAFAGVLAAAGPLVGVAAAVAFALSALGTAAAPILLVVGAVAALAAGFAALYSANLFGIQEGVAAIGAAISSWSATAIENVGAAFTTIAANIQGAITWVIAWGTQIATQGVATQSFLIATQELSAPWGAIARGISGAVAALKLFGGAVTGDMGAAQAKELYTVLNQVFGAEITNRIAAMTIHISQFKAAMASASPSEWLGEISGFASKMGAELGAITTEVKKQIQTAMDEVDVSITIGKANITWSADVKSLQLGPIDVLATPKFTDVQIGPLKVMVTPEVTKTELAGMKLEVTPTVKSFEGGPFDILVTPKWTDIQAGPLKVLVTPEFTKVDIGESFGLQISAGGKIDIKLGAENFTVDLSGAITAVQGGFGLLQTGIIAAWNNDPLVSGVTAAIKGIQWGDLSGSLAPLVDAIKAGLKPPTVEAPETELQTGMQQWRDDLLAGMTTSLTGADFTGTATAVMVGLSGAIQGQDSAGIGEAVWNNLKKGIAAGAAGAAVVIATTMFPGLKSALANLDWTFSSASFSGFKTAVINAFRSIDWSAIQGAVTLFKLSINKAFGDFLGGLITGATGLKQPQWLADFMAWTPSTPQWITNLLAWQPSMPGWVERLIAVLGGGPEPTVRAVSGREHEPFPDTKVPVAFDFTQAESTMAAFLETLPPAEIPAKIVPDKIIDIVIPPFEMPVTPKIEWPTGGQLSDILRESMGGGGADTPMSVRVEAASITAAAGLDPIQVDAILAHVDPPAVMPEIKVKGVMTNDVSQASAGLGSVLSQGASEVASSLSGFKWPAMPPFEWPKLPPFSWPPYDPFKWPAIPRPDWIDSMRVPRPSWLGEMLSWSPQVRVVSGGAPTVPGQIAGSAAGTNYWRGGATWVGEEGPEIVIPPTGSRILSNRESMAMAGAGGGNVTVQFTGPITIASDADLNTLADKLVYLITARQNRRA